MMKPRNLIRAVQYRLIEKRSAHSPLPPHADRLARRICYFERDAYSKPAMAKYLVFSSPVDFSLIDAGGRVKDRPRPPRRENFDHSVDRGLPTPKPLRQRLLPGRNDPGPVDPSAVNELARERGPIRCREDAHADECSHTAVRDRKWPGSRRAESTPPQTTMRRDLG